MRSAGLLLAWMLLVAAVRADELYHDFRSGEPLPEMLSYYGPDAALYINTEPEGLRITLPRERAKLGPTGVQTTKPVSGDFELTVTYEILNIDPVEKAYGAGLNLFARTREADGDHDVILGRFRKPAVEVFSAVRGFPGPDGTPKSQFFKPVPADTKRGQLRLTRSQSQVRYLVAPDNGPFREIKQLEFPTSDVGLIRVSANTGTEAINMDVRVVDLRIKAESFTRRNPVPLPSFVVPPAPDTTKAPPEDPKGEAAPSRGWLVIVVAAVLLGLVAAVVGIWQRRRR